MTTDRALMQQGLVTWVSTLASANYPTPLPSGTVLWQNRARDFIGNTTGAGIYLKIVSLKSPGIDGLQYSAGTAPNTIKPTHTDSMKMRLQIQALSYNETDDDSALNWLSNISDRVWFTESIEALRLNCNCSIISTGQITMLDGLLDDRAASVGTFDLVLHWRSNVVGLDISTIDGLSGTYSIDGRTGTIRVP